MDLKLRRTNRPSRCSALKVGLVSLLAGLCIICLLYVNIFTVTQQLDDALTDPVTQPTIMKKRRPGKFAETLILKAEGPIHFRISANQSKTLELVLKIDSDELQDLVEDYRMGFSSPAPVYPSDTKFILSNPDLCRDSTALDWIVYVHSAVFNAERRQLLRDTWANTRLFATLRFKVIFLVGRAGTAEDQAVLKEEFEVHKDIVQGDFNDDYKNLTYKAVMGLKWISTYCPQARYGLKADDDTFMNIFAMIGEMRNHTNSSSAIICPLWGDNAMPILRERKSCMKWCVKKRELPGRTHFPQYCAGIGYAVSSPLIGHLYRAAQSTPFFWIDDVYVTGLLVKKVPMKVEFVSLLERFTLQEERALEQMKNQTEPIRYYFVHTHNRHVFVQLWNLMLDRLSSAEAQQLSARPESFKLSVT